MARPWPVLPEVGSTMVPPGFRRPSRSAASIIRSPMRSFTLPPGFSISSFARMAGRTPPVTCRRRTSGVFPIASRNVSRTLTWVFSPAVPPGGQASAADQAVDAARVAEVDGAVRPDLHRQDPRAVAVHDGLAGHPEPVRGKPHPSDVAGGVRAG